MELFNTTKMISLNEVTLIPASKSYIESRSHCNPYIGDTNKLPIFIAPMTCLINNENYNSIRESKFIPILPVSYRYNDGSKIFTKKSYKWQAISINSLKNINIDTLTKDSSNILIDCANGNMNIIFETVKKIKAKLKDDISIMIGNIANPETYEQCILSGVDYVRVGIGGGGGCLTSVNTGIHCSLPWIIKECVDYLEKGIVPTTITPIQKFDMILKHIDLLEAQKSDRLANLEMRTHISYYLKGIPNSIPIKEKTFKAKNLEELKTLIKEYREVYKNGENI